MMHWVKHIVGIAAMPLSAAFVIALLAGFFRLRGQRRPALWLVLSASAIVYLSALDPIGSILLGSLERQYPPLLQNQPLPAVDYIVVLGSGYDPRDGIPLTAAFDPDGLVRIVEGIRLQRRLPSARLVVSGGARPGHVPPAHGYTELARELGVEDSSLIVLDTPLDTASEARAIVGVLGKSPFLLVTSAGHMPRAVRLMSSVGAHPLPAPTGQRDRRAWTGGLRILLPTSAALGNTERALHEYLGMIALAAGIS